MWPRVLSVLWGNHGRWYSLQEAASVAYLIWRFPSMCVHVHAGVLARMRG
jgi:hypothetical protein